MNLRQACGVGALVTLMSCGGADLFGDGGVDGGADGGADGGQLDAGMDAGVIYAFTTGTYAVTQAMNAPSTTDVCGLLPAYQASGKVIGVTVVAPTVTFNLANDPNAMLDTLPTATLTGDSIGVLTEANYTVAYGTTCVVRVHRSVVGTVVATDTAALTLSFSAATESGTCTGGATGNTSFAALPCTGNYQFTATRQ